MQGASRIRVPADNRIRELFPTVKPEADGSFLLTHTPATSVLLRGLGFDVQPAVIQPGNYDWSHGSPFDVQRHTVGMLTENHRAYVLSSMGTGKTRCALWAFDYLRRVGAAKRMLVICPLSTMRFTWGKEIFECVPHLTYEVLHGTKAKRQAALKREADIYIINHDGIKVLYDDLMQRADIDIICIDELAVFRNKTDRTETMVEMAKHKSIVWGMTGAPTPNSPTDVFWQAKIITPNNVPKYFGRFREALMYKVNQFKWLPKTDAVEKAISCLRPSVRFTLDDITELPGFESQILDVQMGPRQARIYKEMHQAAYALVQDHAITAANAGAVVNKLLQISLGWVYTREKGVVRLDNQPRIQALLDILQAADRKVIILVPYLHAMQGIMEDVRNAGYEPALVHGDVPLYKRDRIFQAFQNTDQINPLIAHPRCIAHGLTLTAANCIVWFGPLPSLEIYEQATMRIRRVGQTHRQLFLHLQATPAERRLYRLLIDKLSIQDQLLSVIEDESWANMTEEAA